MIRSILENRIGSVLLCSFALGLLFPQFALVPTVWLSVLVATQIFFSAFKIDIREIRSIQLGPALLFYISRFVALPIALYLAAVGLGENYAIGILLLALMPSGVASPALATVFRGNVSLTLLFVCLSGLLCPLVIPTVVGLLTSTHITVDSWTLFQALFFTVVVPIVVHIPLRAHSAFSTWMKENSSWMNITVLIAVVVIAVSKNRDLFLSNFSVLALALIATFILYFILYLFGWLFARTTTWENKISFTISSGANNNMLGIGIAMLYFPREVSVLLLVSEAPWIGSVGLFKMFLRKKLKQTGE